jgi:hypothetical protein
MSLVTVFDTLFFVYLLLTLLAFWRLRAATLIVAGNQLSVVRALSLATEIGQPRSQSFLPASVYSTDSLEIAALLCALQAVVLAAFVLWPEPAQPARQQPLPEVPRWLRWGLGAYFLAVIFSSRTILTHGYVDPDRAVFGLNLSGFHALLASVLLYEVVRRVKVGLTTPFKGFAFMLGLFFFTDYIKGGTGLATGYVVTAAILLFREERKPLRRWVLLGASLAACVLLAAMVRSVRTNLHTTGTEAFAAFASQIGGQEEGTSRNAEGLEMVGNGTQYAAHLLECISLYEAGVSREWRSVYLPVVYTFKPSFLVEPLGLDRPKEAAWELGEYYIHGGGIFVLGELYWNGGYFCVATVLAGLFWYCRRCDTASRTSAAWLMLVCQLSPSLLQGIGYGFAQASRGLLNGLVVLVAWRALQLVTGRPASGGSVAGGAPATGSPAAPA